MFIVRMAVLLLLAKVRALKSKVVGQFVAKSRSTKCCLRKQRLAEEGHRNRHEDEHKNIETSELQKDEDSDCCNKSSGNKFLLSGRAV